jgi:hypothetical protein
LCTSITVAVVGDPERTRDGRDRPARQPVHLLVAALLAQRQVDAPALEPDAVGQQRDPVQVERADPVPAHRGQDLDQDPRLDGQVGQGSEVLQPGDRGEHLGVLGQLHRQRVARVPRVEDDDGAGEHVPDLGDLRGNPDGQGVHAQPGGLLGQPLQPEPVPVALGHWHQAGRPGGLVGQVRPPERDVQVQGQSAHPVRLPARLITLLRRAATTRQSAAPSSGFRSGASCRRRTPCRAAR